MSHNHPDELARLFSGALKRLERQRAAAPAQGEKPAGLTLTRDNSDVVDRSRPEDDPLAAIVALFDQLLSALSRMIESGQSFDYGAFVFDELQRIRGDVDA